MNTKAIETITFIISSNTSFFNDYYKNTDLQKEKMAELNGMMICLKNLYFGDKHYDLKFNEDGSLEFGYYENHIWNKIEG